MKFNFPKRADESLAENGVEFKIKDELGQEWGTYKLKWMDRESARGKAIWIRASKKYKGAIKAGTITAEELGRAILIENFLIDWDLPTTMTGGKKLPYSIEAANEFFAQPETFWLAEKLADLAEDITNFAVVLDAEGEAVEPEKN